MARRSASKTRKQNTPIDEALRTVSNETGETTGNRHHYVVGIGASAGGLEALTALVSRLPGGLGMSYVVVQHLSPSYKSMLPQLLGRETSMPVIEIVTGQQPQPDTIYITPPNRNVVFRDGRLELLQSPREIMPKPSVNLFLGSLAEERREDAVGIILSGTGSDGASGIRAVKAGGGFTFAQEPKCARYDGMPQSAIDTGCVDWVLTAEGIAEELARLSEARPVLPTTELEDLPATLLKRLLNKVRARTKLDFSGYKETTLWRRVERRLFANRVPSLDAYLALVDTQPEELERLAKDILISVTSFFRDRESFAALDHVLKTIVERKQSGDEIRVWVPGCATGEEAYSIAIMLHRLLGTSFEQYRIQIFATDVDLEAMQVARRGVYASALLSELDPDIAQRYFRPSSDRFEIVKSIRDVVIFARQDLVLDPPFLRLDMISCRNVLIYLQSALQARILSLFHYALLPDGHLFLGKSESVAQQDLLFVPENKEARIFRRRPESGRTLPATASALPATAEIPLTGAAKPAAPREQAILKAASAIYVPPSVVVNSQMQILHVLGDASSYLQIPAGKASLDLGSLLVRDLRVEAQALLRLAEQRRNSVTGRQRLPLHGRTGPMIRLSVHPLESDGGEQLFLICFVPAEDAPELPASRTSAENDSQRSELEDELVATREHLQTLVEELETSNEEMQALNEEVQAANEELQATNEELEASNEELQSTNEELLTINEELQVKSTDLTRANADLESIQDNVGMPIIVTDGQLRVTRFNAAAEVLFKMHRGLIGEALDRLLLPRGMEHLGASASEAVARRRPYEGILAGDGREYLLRITLMFGDTDAVIGVIISLLEQTDLLRTSRLLQESESRLRAVLDHTEILIAIKDVSGHYLYANPRYSEYFGSDDDAMIGKTDGAFLKPEQAKRFRDEELIALRRHERIDTLEQTATLQGVRWLAFARFALLDATGNVYAVCVQAEDVTEKRHADEQLRLAARVIENAAEAIIITDADQRIVTVNDAFTHITGYSIEDVRGQRPSVLSSGNHDADFYRAMWAQISAQGTWRGEIDNRRKSGEVFTEWLTINIIRNNEGDIVNYVGIFSDVSELREARRQLEFQAMHDPLTELPNRALFNDRARRAVARAQRRGQPFAIVFIDLDNFKDINDSFGHECGDRVLREVSRRLVEAMREPDTVARLGGDEFVLLVEELRDGEIEYLVERCRSALDAPFIDGGREQRITASMGIAIYPEDGNEVDELLKSADAAMYQAKQAGRDTYTFSSPEIRRAPVERLKLIGGLRRALAADGELWIAFQPQFDLPGRRLIGLEALMRWRSPDLGEISPVRFIPLAEETGLIAPLTDWLLTRAVAQITAWRKAGLDLPRVSINVSPQQLRDSALALQISQTLAGAGLPASVLGVELTESALTHSPEQVAATLLAMKNSGITCSLDDFGTGYSSLSRLTHLPIGTLKIDRSFIDGLGAKKHAHAVEIVRTIILMAHSLGMTALAEGVETEAQLAMLTTLGCDAVQGFLCGRPMPADEIASLAGAARTAPSSPARRKKKSP